MLCSVVLGQRADFLHEVIQGSSLHVLGGCGHSLVVPHSGHQLVRGKATQIQLFLNVGLELAPNVCLYFPSETSYMAMAKSEEENNSSTLCNRIKSTITTRQLVILATAIKMLWGHLHSGWGWGSCKSQRPRMPVRPCLLEMTRAIHDTSTMWLLKQDLNNDTTNRHAIKEPPSHEPPLQRIGNSGMPSGRIMSFP